jgi:predicted Co/Zn/Cd cation transporter (cation efflux family)
MFWMQRRAFKRTQSALIEVDAKQWLVDGVISGGVGAAFVTGAILERTAFAPWVNYLDPTIVVILVIFTISVPIRIVRENLWQVLLGAPSKELQAQLSSKLDGVLDRHGFKQYNLRMARAGRSSLLLVHVLVPNDSSSPKEVSALDRVRSELHESLASELTHYSLDVVFTQDRRWFA